MVAYDNIIKFVKNIYYAKGLKFDEDYTAMWIREINTTGAALIDLHNAEITIIRDNIPLRINDVCETIKETINKSRPKIIYPKKTNCPYCEGRGWVEALKFETNGKYTGSTYAISCCCGSSPIPNSVTMKEDLSNHHRTEVKDGYYLIFPSVVEEFEYIDKVYANDNYDLRRS